MKNSEENVPRVQRLPGFYPTAKFHFDEACNSWAQTFLKIRSEP